MRPFFSVVFFCTHLWGTPLSQGCLGERGVIAGEGLSLYNEGEPGVFSGLNRSSLLFERDLSI